MDREKRLKENQERMRLKRLDPEFLKQEAARMRDLRKDAEFRAKERIAKRNYERERYANDAEYRAKELLRKNALRRESRTDDEYRRKELDRANARRRERRSSEPQYREHQIKLQKASRERHPEASLFRSKKQYADIRSKLLEMYGSECECCKESEPLFLELDHIKGGGLKHFKEMKSPWHVYRQATAQYQPDTYRILCTNCNRGRQRNGGTCPHKVLI